MVNDPTIEREQIGGDEPMGDPAEIGPQTTREGGDYEVEEEPDETLTEGTPRERTLP
jgi:hypothetical protein